MRAPRITQENLENQNAVVQEEIRVNVLNRPYGGFPWITLPPVAFRSFPNAHNGYGDFSELEAATLDDAAAFFNTYYAPGNAVLSLAGDLDPAEVAHGRALFRPDPRRGRSRRDRTSPSPPDRGEARLRSRSARAAAGARRRLSRPRSRYPE